jgi:hypothetical protein
VTLREGALVQAHAGARARLLRPVLCWCLAAAAASDGCVGHEARGGARVLGGMQQ